MFRSTRLAPVALLFFTSASVSAAQAPAKSTTSKTADSKPAAARSAASADAEQQLKIRRGQARSLLIALSTDARTFRDQTLRARSLARIADALWTVDAEQARALFRKAWDAAEVADLESDRKMQEDIEQQKSKNGGGFAISLPPNLRREVLKLAATHDRALGEEFLEKLKAQKSETPSTASTLRPGRTSDALNQRLSVAADLLQAGEMERALQFADPALTVVAMESINFLSNLREKNVAAADERYSALLTASANNPQSDGNTVSLLSSYIFTPHLFVFFTNNGVNSSQMTPKVVPADVSPELRNAFFQAAASILLRPVPPVQDPNALGLETRYQIVKHILPLFEKFAPAEITESLQANLNALNAVVSEEAKQRDDEWNDRSEGPEQPARDREQSLLDRIDREKISAERDALYIELALLTSNRGDLKARDYVNKIEDLELRKHAQAYIDPSLAMRALQKKSTDQALDLVQKGEFSHLQKVWVLTQCVKLLAPTDKDKAAELVEAAAAEARRIDVSDPSRPQALIAVANATKMVDAPRVWDATFEAVKAANSAEGFTGEDAKLTLKLQSKKASSLHSSDVPEFDLEGIFRDLADADYERAVELARGFQGEGPRAVATIAIARAVLQPKKRS